MTAQSPEHIHYGCNPIGLLEPQAADVRKNGPLIGCGGNRQNGHEIGNIRRADGQVILQCRQQPGTGPVPLGRIRIQISNLNGASKGLSGQKESGVTPIALYGHSSRTVKSAVSGETVVITGNPETLHSGKGHGYIGGGFQFSKNLQTALT